MPYHFEWVKKHLYLFQSFFTARAESPTVKEPPVQVQLPTAPRRNERRPSQDDAIDLDPATKIKRHLKKAATRYIV